ncbi:MAG: rod shape-determining protein MreC [Nitrospiraceae bacterium]|nr:MAG: rod shape-determining protein MreC [Nitrospiraceae bacterium]
MFKRKFILLALFVLLVFALLTYQSIKKELHLLDFVIYPLKVLEQGGNALTGVFRYLPFFGKDDTLERLGRCEKEKTDNTEAAYENERLRSLLELKSVRPDFIAAAGVVAREPTNWFQIVWLDKGLGSGISKDMVAVTPLGLVGRVHRVFNKRANVILITDVNSAVAVRLQSSRIEGILEGNGDNKCYLKYVSKDFDVAEGENVITSGLDGIYPEGVLAGYISSVDRESGEVFQLIEVTPAQPLNSVEEVAVLKR